MTKEPIELSQREYDLLNDYHIPYYIPFEKATYPITHLSLLDRDFYNDPYISCADESTEKRLFEAIIYGYKLKESEKYYLVAAETKEQQETLNGGTCNDKYYKFADLYGDHWGLTQHYYTIDELTNSTAFSYTQADIDAAPEWVKSLVRIPVDTVK